MDDFFDAPDNMRGSSAQVKPATPGSFDQNFDTVLNPSDETAFQYWKNQNAPQDTGVDYDLRGAYKAGLKPAGADAGANAGHWSDRFKKPSHPTFSNESQYASWGNPGSWRGDTYIPGKRRK